MIRESKISGIDCAVVSDDDLVEREGSAAEICAGEIQRAGVTVEDVNRSAARSARDDHAVGIAIVANAAGGVVRWREVGITVGAGGHAPKLRDDGAGHRRQQRNQHRRAGHRAESVGDDDFKVIRRRGGQRVGVVGCVGYVGERGGYVGAAIAGEPLIFEWLCAGRANGKVVHREHPGGADGRRGNARGSAGLQEDLQSHNSSLRAQGGDHPGADVGLARYVAVCRTVGGESHVPAKSGAGKVAHVINEQIARSGNNAAIVRNTRQNVDAVGATYGAHAHRRAERDVAHGRGRQRSEIKRNIVKRCAVGRATPKGVVGAVKCNRSIKAPGPGGSRNGNLVRREVRAVRRRKDSEVAGTAAGSDELSVGARPASEKGVTAPDVHRPRNGAAGAAKRDYWHDRTRRILGVPAVDFKVAGGVLTVAGVNDPVIGYPDTQ